MTYQTGRAQTAAASRAGTPHADAVTGIVGRPSTAPDIRVRATARAVLALGLYMALSIAYVGRAALANPSGGTIGVGPDVQIFLWSLRWWPYALLHGINPLVSHAIWAPHGSDILWTSTVPLLSLLAAPVTLTLGPAAAWNLLSVLAPALSAFGAFLLCRELTRAFWPSLAGGVIFGFSSYELAESIAHLHVTFTLLVPLAALLVVRYMRGRMGGPSLALRTAVIAAAQFLISPEILVTLLVMGTIAAVATLALVPGAGARLRSAIKWISLGLAGAPVVTAPVLVAMLGTLPSGPMNAPTLYSADLVNLFVPTPVTALGSAWTTSVASHFPGNLAEQVAYLGAPLLAVVAAAVLSGRARPAVRVLTATFVSAVVLSFGPRLHVDGQATIWLPGWVVTQLPGLDDALPVRFSLYGALAAGALVALWLAATRRPSPWRWAAVLVVLVSLAPAATRAFWWQSTPAAIAHNDLGRLIPGGSAVLSLPFWAPDDRALYAQAQAGMSFTLDDRWLQLIPRAYLAATRDPALAAPSLTRAQIPAFERDVCVLRANYAVVWNGRRQMLSALGLEPRAADNLLIYRLPLARYCAMRGAL